MMPPPPPAPVSDRAVGPPSTKSAVAGQHVSWLAGNSLFGTACGAAPAYSEPAQMAPGGGRFSSEHMVAALEVELRGTKRPKGCAESMAAVPHQQMMAMHTQHSAQSLCSNESGDSGSKDGSNSNDSGSWATGAYLVAKFTGFCAKLARKRRVSRAVVPPPPQPAQPMSTGLKLSILEKLDALLEHGDEKQLAHIDEALGHLSLRDANAAAAAAAAMQPPASMAPAMAHGMVAQQTPPSLQQPTSGLVPSIGHPGYAGAMPPPRMPPSQI